MKTIANYEILETISQSGPSAVYVARHKKLGRKTLLKVYSGADQTLIDRFEREARIVAELNSDAIVAIYDFGGESGEFFISMEYIDGWNLEEYLAAHKLTEEEIIDFSYQISYCVAVLHQKGYIHRDLKPENILVDRNKRIKLTDFGLTLHESLNRITSEGDLLGTPLYMSPEQINNNRLTAASDVFSMGIIFYQMATQIHPFNAEQVGEVFSRILTFKPENICTLRPSLPKWYCDLVSNLLNKDAGSRPNSALDVFLQIKEHSAYHLNKAMPEALQSKRSSSKRLFGVYISLFFVLMVFWYFFGYDSIKTYFWFASDSSITAKTDSVQKDSTVSYDPTDSSGSSASAEQPVTPAKNHSSNNDSLKNTLSENALAEENATFMIKTYPWCNVFLDYKLVATTPLPRPLPVKPGRYVLGLQNPNYPSYTDTIRIEAFKLNTFAYNLDSLLLRLDLQVLPWGNVYIDEKFIGTTPLQKPLYLTPGKYVLKITNDFYPTWVDTIVYDKNSANRKQIVLDFKNINNGIN